MAWGRDSECRAWLGGVSLPPNRPQQHLGALHKLPISSWPGDNGSSPNRGSAHGTGEGGRRAERQMRGPLVPRPQCLPPQLERPQCGSAHFHALPSATEVSFGAGATCPWRHVGGSGLLLSVALSVESPRTWGSSGQQSIRQAASALVVGGRETPMPPFSECFGAQVMV